MGHGKSPVDELVDGIDAIGSMLDENLPRFSSKLDDLQRQQPEISQRLIEIRSAAKEISDSNAELRRALASLDVRTEEIMATIGVLTRRVESLQKSVLELCDALPRVNSSDELSDSVKMLEDRMKKLESQHAGNRLNNSAL